MPLHLGAFVLSNKKRIMNNFMHGINGFYKNDVFYTDTDSLYIENKHWDNNDNGFLFLAPETKYCLTINKYGVIDDHKFFKGFYSVSDNLDRKEYFKTFNGDKLFAKVPLSWGEIFSMGIVIPHKNRNCNKVSETILCDECDKLVNQNVEFSANLNVLESQPPNSSGLMLPKYITT